MGIAWEAAGPILLSSSPDTVNGIGPFLLDSYLALNWSSNIQIFKLFVSFRLHRYSLARRLMSLPMT